MGGLTGGVDIPLRVQLDIVAKGEIAAEMSVQGGGMQLRAELSSMRGSTMRGSSVVIWEPLSH